MGLQIQILREDCILQLFQASASAQLFSIYFLYLIVFTDLGKGN